MLYTVKETAEIAKVTIKTLHYYQKIGLLLPNRISEAGYRFYGTKELERLQEILFYRELDFPLQKIKQLLDGESDRFVILSEQKKLLLSQEQRLERLVQTIDQSITSTIKGVDMDYMEMFKGFQSEKEWKEAMEGQQQYLKEKYDYDLFDEVSIDVDEMNESAREAKHFMDGMAQALSTGLTFNDEKVRRLIQNHLTFLNEHGHEINPIDFATQSRFFLNDEFHRKMLENQQTGLSYFLCIAAEAFATNE